jgi:hypothetical protein
VNLFNCTIIDYYNMVTDLVNTLASIGQPLRPTDFISYLLNRLDGNYDTLVENIYGCDIPIQPHKLYSCLLAKEQRIKASDATLGFSFVNTASRGKLEKTGTIQAAAQEWQAKPRDLTIASGTQHPHGRRSPPASAAYPAAPRFLCSSMVSRITSTTSCRTWVAIWQAKPRVRTQFTPAPTRHLGFLRITSTLVAVT